jgi:hypothetical protein
MVLVQLHVRCAYWPALDVRKVALSIATDSPLHLAGLHVIVRAIPAAPAIRAAPQPCQWRTETAHAKRLQYPRAVLHPPPRCAPSCAAQAVDGKTTGSHGACECARIERMNQPA